MSTGTRPWRSTSASATSRKLVSLFPTTMSSDEMSRMTRVSRDQPRRTNKGFADHVKEFGVAIGLPLAPFVKLHQFCALDQRARVHLEFIGPKIPGRRRDDRIPGHRPWASNPKRFGIQCAWILNPSARSWAQGRARCRDVVTARIRGEHGVRKALDPDLHLGDAEAFACKPPLRGSPRRDAFRPRDPPGGPPRIRSAAAGRASSSQPGSDPDASRLPDQAFSVRL